MSIIPEWNSYQKRLKETIKKQDSYNEAKELFIMMHGMVHFAQSCETKEPAVMDKLWEDLDKEHVCIMPKEDDVTIAWNIWHITRIEDLTVNLLINNSEQVLNKEWLERLNVNVTDTGNAMTDDEIIAFSKQVNIQELKNYRIAVGERTQKILRNLGDQDMKRKIEKAKLDKILLVGGVLEHPDSIWLLDFWGKKDIAGIILMPVTRHQIVHLNDCANIKKAINSKKEFFRI